MTPRPRHQGVTQRLPWDRGLLDQSTPRGYVARLASDRHVFGHRLLGGPVACRLSRMGGLI
jgi:hypothetical protein